MLCQRCKNAEATVHIQQVIDTQKTAIHLCDACAAAHDAAEDEEVKLATLLYKLAAKKILKTTPAGGKTEPFPEADDPAADVTCPRCGWLRHDLQSLGRLGCDHCYDVFAEDLQILIRRLHRGCSHRGRRPGTDAPPADRLAALRIQRQLDSLGDELAQVVADEHYEEAARLRDRIRVLSQQAVDATPDA